MEQIKKIDIEKARIKKQTDKIKFLKLLYKFLIFWIAVKIYLCIGILGGILDNNQPFTNLFLIIPIGITFLENVCVFKFIKIAISKEKKVAQRKRDKSQINKQFNGLQKVYYI